MARRQPAGLEPMPDAATLRRLKAEREGKHRASPAVGSSALPPVRVPVLDVRARMNRTERLWADHLDTLIVAGELAEWRYEEVTFSLGHDCRYTPDFLLLWRDGRLTFDDVKGSQTWDDAKAKIRIAARLFPFFTFRIARKPRGVTTFTVYDIPA